MTENTKRNCSILVIENDPVLQRLVTDHLSADGFSVKSASSQKEGEALMASTPFDLLITELMLEETDSGFLLCYHFKRRYPAGKAVILTDAAAKTGIHFDLSAEDAKEWIKADAILDKTIRLEQLDSLIRRICFSN